MKHKEYMLSQSLDNIFRGINVKEDTDKGIDYYEISMQDFNGSEILKPTTIKTNGSEDQIKLKRLRRGDIIIPSRASLSNKIAIFNVDTPTYCIVNHQYWIIRTEPNLLDSYYLLFFLLSSGTKDILNNDPRNISKSGMVTVSKETLKELKIALPPIEEQRKMKNFFQASQMFYNFINDTDKIHQQLYNELYLMEDTNPLSLALKETTEKMEDIKKSYDKVSSLL